MTTALMQSTQIQFNLTVNVNVNADKVLFLIAAVIVFVARKLKQAKQEWSFLKSDFLEATRFTSTVFTIGFRSLAWGIGMRL